MSSLVGVETRFGGGGGGGGGGSELIERERENVCVFVRIWSGGKNRREIDKGRGVSKLGLPLFIIMGIEPRKTKSPLTQQGLANK